MMIKEFKYYRIYSIKECITICNTIVYNQKP